MNFRYNEFDELGKVVKNIWPVQVRASKSIRSDDVEKLFGEPGIRLNYDTHRISVISDRRFAIFDPNAEGLIYFRCEKDAMLAKLYFG